MLSRALSSIVALAYLVLVFFLNHSRTAGDTVKSLLFTAVVLVFPLALIWFGDEFGEYVGMLPGPAINRRSPGLLVKIGGWVLLLLPVIAFGISYTQQ